MTDNPHTPPPGSNPSQPPAGGNGNQYGNAPQPQYPGQQHPGQPQNPGQSQYPGQPQGQQFPGQPQGQQFPGQPQGQQFPGQPQGQQFPGQQYPGQQYPGQQYPGQQYHGQQFAQPGYPQQYGGAPAGLRYNPANGRPMYPGTYLTAIILASISLVFSLISLLSLFGGQSSSALYGLGGVFAMMIAYYAALVLGGGAGLFGIIQGFSWGRLVYAGSVALAFIIGVIGLATSGAMEAIGLLLLPLILPILAIIMLFLPNSTDYIKAIAPWKASAQGQQGRTGY